MQDFLVRGSLAELDPDIHELIQLESERQYRKLILIPSESTAPLAVREAMGSSFQNLYAEGYPDEDTRWMPEKEILNYEKRLAQYRRYADPRYYKGVEYADIVEALARRRCAEVFATASLPAEKLFVNVQPLSGAPANNAVYTALVEPGDSVLSMNLLHGGHLSHGSPVNRSGKLFKISHYTADPQTEQINYDALQQIALETRPKIIIAGYSSYPWVPDWERFRAIADSVGAYLLADVSHIAGLIAAGAIPSPVGFAHILTFTTHKTLCGPRGACIITDDAELSKKLDRAVFPGEQGGPHVHIFAALALTFKLAKTEAFRSLQQQILKNCQALTNRLAERGLRISYGGTNTHLGNIDCKSVKGPDGTPLSGDMAARILELAGIVLNRNTIPGDKSALSASGIRYGTPWVTQRGLKEADMVKIADIMADVLYAITPYKIQTRSGSGLRAKIDFGVLENAKLRTREIAETAGIDSVPTKHGYPHYWFIDEQPKTKLDHAVYDLSGTNIRHFVNYCFTSNPEELAPGKSQKTRLITPQETVEGVLTYVGENQYRLTVPRAQATLAATWLRDMSDGYVKFDADVTRRMPGPVVVSESDAEPVISASGEAVCHTKPYYIGIESASGEPLPPFTWQEKESEKSQRTPLYEVHKKLNAKIIPFAGWEMPVWYTSVLEEHAATRQAAGLFDVSHMGVLQAEGPYASVFLDSVCANDIGLLAVGQSCYTHFLDPDGNVIDDTIVYRRSQDKYLVVVNAANDEKDWAWLTSVLEGRVRVDRVRPWVKAFGQKVTLRNLRDPKEGPDMRIDIALQGPKSRDILLSLGCDQATKQKVVSLKRTELCEAVIGGFDLVVSRTGYTGEKMAFELFIHPSNAVAFWEALMNAGVEHGLKPCGLGARDSLRTEAGLPLYGHEMGGALGLGVAEAGFGAFVKVYKPWFIGREAYIEREAKRQGVVVRFRFNEKGVRMAHLGDPVLDAKGRVIGKVTSCAIDSEGFLTGQAFVEIKSSAEGTPIAIYQGSPNTAGKPPAELQLGDRITLPTPATIISRFP
ncbi:MAG: glycine cleavage system aminomethyltransferase GcvT [Anaerolineae bacterium]|nr:glycine cleavage system aminomethyltransferase GcvT [Anaerolineae bacterium]